MFLSRCSSVLRSPAGGRTIFRSASTAANSAEQKTVQMGWVPLVLGLTGGVALAINDNTAEASGDTLHAPLNRPAMTGKVLSYDTASLRRGWQVYKQVCATCHSLDGIRYGQLVNAILLEEEAKAVAADIEVIDGPDDTGDMFTRPGKLTDPIVRPYENAEAARFANNGALPPSLTLLIGARHNGSHYVWSVLTGYKEAPAGVKLASGMHYNPYFAGGQIAMPPPLSDGMVEFEDGTEASISQMAKDVTHFMEWALAPRWNEDKHVEVKKVIVLSALAAACFYWNKTKWAVIKTRQLRRF